MKQLRLTIFGAVQGVNFRLFVRDHARHLGLAGWVKNNPDGALEVVAEGEENGLLKLRELCATGPEFACVEKIEEEWKEIFNVQFFNFQIRF